jgi:hypothetical protein
MRMSLRMLTGALFSAGLLVTEVGESVVFAADTLSSRPASVSSASYYRVGKPPGSANASEGWSESDGGDYSGGGGDSAPSYVNDLAQSPLAMAPNMIGDFYGGYLTWQEAAYIPQEGTVAVGGGDRRFKINENNSPFPRDRVFFNYHHFQNALRCPNNTDRSLDRFVFGLEKTCLQDALSLELRVPFAVGLDSDQYADAAIEGTEFGNMALAAKGLLYVDDCQAFSAGVAVTLPTADDSQIAYFDFGTSSYQPFFRVENESVFLQPFVGYFVTLSECAFFQAFGQVDFDTNGSTVTDRDGLTGRLQDQTLAYLDGSFGYWLCRRPEAHLVRGIAGLVELHYSSTLNDADVVSGVTNRDNRLDVLNLTSGLHFQLGTAGTLRVGAVAPLNDDAGDRMFDTEIFAQFNRYF